MGTTARSPRIEGITYGMDSRYELSIPSATTPIKMEPNGENILCASPSLQPDGELASMINTGGTPIASLKTPTKVLMSQNSTGRHSMTISPTRLYVKQHADTDQSNQNMPVPIAPAIRNAATVIPPTYQMTKAQKPQYLRIVSNQENGQPTYPRQNPNLQLQSNVQQNDHFQHHVASVQHQQPTISTPSIIHRPMNGGNVGQRVLLPAGNAQTLRISGSQSLAHIHSQLPPGTTILSGSDSSGQMLALLPTSHAVTSKITVPTQLYSESGQMTASPQDYQQRPPEVAVLMPDTNTQVAVSQNNSAPDANKQKKPCNCTKSQCLKLYCDCFANGEFCANCNCQNCYNNLDHEEERQKAVKQCLERNPQAFHPKIGKSAKADARRHQKGCNCKRSGCLKNYCECYEAKIPCGSMCKCVGCKNCESHDHKGLMRLADAADIRQSQPPHEHSTFPLQTPAPHSYLKKPVIEAVIDCLIAQCREAETAKCKDSTTEKVILEEYGRCLSELIKASSQNGRAN